LVGTVWEDSNGNRLYDPGEGIGGIRVEPDRGRFYAITGTAGGYAIPVEPGNYLVVFSGASLIRPITHAVTVGAESKLIPWVTFPSEVEAASQSITLTQSGIEYRATWRFYLGEPSGVETSDGRGFWTAGHEQITQQGNQLNYSVVAPFGRGSQFWRIRSWRYLE